MRQTFINYLIENGYKEYTPKGLPSTAYNYAVRIDTVIYWEHYQNWEDVAENIDRLCKEYAPGGIKEKRGATSHSSVINALRRFYEFLNK